MEKYLNAPIKEIIRKFPEVGKILEEYNIGCVSCTLGSCLLMDIVAIHNLGQEQEQELMRRIEKAVYPGRNIKKPVCPAPKKEPGREIKYSPPIKRLVDEHALIKKWIGLIPQAIENADIESESGSRLISDGLDFIRYYADKFHHAKEEDILFEYTDRNLDIIQTILTDHEVARAHVKAASAALKMKNKRAVGDFLNAYKGLLAEHIKKEDEVLYPWIERGLSISQVGELFRRFNEAEEMMDKAAVEKCRKFILELEQRMQDMEIKKEAAK